MKNCLLIKYRYGGEGQHILDTLRSNEIGIPTKQLGGRLRDPGGTSAFRRASNTNPLYYALYDSDSGEIRNCGVSTGVSWVTENSKFVPDPRVPGENWGHRLRVIPEPNPRGKVITRDTFEGAMGGKIYKGTGQSITEEQWDNIKARLT